MRASEIVVVPTDTVYGIAALPECPDAVATVYVAKGRPAGMPLPVLASSLPQVRALGVDLPPAALALAERWWPGPLTLALGLSEDPPPPEWLSGRDEVAVRIPRHPFLLGLMARSGVLLVTSANLHGTPTPHRADDALAMVAPHARLVIDGGVLDGAASTLVNVAGGRVVIEREGAIAAGEIEAVVAGART